MSALTIINIDINLFLFEISVSFTFNVYIVCNYVVFSCLKATTDLCGQNVLFNKEKSDCTTSLFLKSLT